MSNSKGFIAIDRQCHNQPQHFCSICNVRSMFWGEMIFHDKNGEMSYLVICDKCVTMFREKAEALEDLALTSEYREGTDAWRYYPTVRNGMPCDI